MIRVSVNPRKLGSWEGLLLILGMVAGIYAVSFVSRVIAALTGFAQAELAVWLLGVVAVVWMMRRFLYGYRYTLHEDVFYVERLFGSQSRVLFQVRRQDLLALDEKSVLLTDDRHISEKLLCARCSLPRKVLLYRTDGQERLMEFQATEEMLEALKSVCEANQTA